MLVLVEWVVVEFFNMKPREGNPAGVYMRCDAMEEDKCGSIDLVVIFRDLARLSSWYVGTGESLSNYTRGF